MGSRSSCARTIRVIAAVFVLSAAGGVVPARSATGVAREPKATWGTGPAGDRKAERVLAVVESGGVVYLGGEFTGMVPPKAEGDAGLVPRRHLAALEAAGGTLTDWNPDADGPVRAMALSQDGKRLYVGGAFNSIGGQPARNVAALDLATGTLDPSFRPPVLNSGVRALALHDDRLYVGGNFTEVRLSDGALIDRPQLAAFDASTGGLLDWLPPDNGGGEYFGQTGEESSSGDGIVYALEVSGDGRTVYAAGSFLDFGGQPALISLDAATGEPTAWQADMDRPAFGLAVSPADGHMLYAATGGAGGRLMALDPGGDEEPVWEVKVDGDGVGVVASETTVYLLGHYDFIVSAESDCYQRCPGGPERHHLAAFDATTGEIDPWDPSANTSTGPYSGAVGAGRLWIGGEFGLINGKPQPGIAQFPGVP